MIPDEGWFPSHLREIDQADCLDLLAAFCGGVEAGTTALLWHVGSLRSAALRLPQLKRFLQETRRSLEEA